MKTRYREQKRLFRKSLLVLQVGIESKLGYYHSSTDPYNTPPPHWDENATVLTWRDATITDLQLIAQEEDE